MHLAREAQTGDVCKGPQTHFVGFGSTVLYQPFRKFYFVHRKTLTVRVVGLYTHKPKVYSFEGTENS